MNIQEYTLSHPFNLVSDNNKPTYNNLNSIEYKKIKGSFRVFFCKKIDFSGFRHDGEKNQLKTRLSPILKIRELITIKTLHNYYYLHKDYYFL